MNRAFLGKSKSILMQDNLILILDSEQSIAEAFTEKNMRAMFGFSKKQYPTCQITQTKFDEEVVVVFSKETQTHQIVFTEMNRVDEDKEVFEKHNVSLLILPKN